VFDKLDRPDWDIYFMTLCFVVSQRSLDPDTKHGCVVVNEDNTILSVGYNSPPRGCNDSAVPLTRPSKYAIFIHSENAAILNAAREGVRLKGSIFYITGHPCEKCVREMLNVGAKEVIFGPVGSACVTEETKSIISNMTIGRLGFKMTEFRETSMVNSILNKTIDYMDGKLC